MVERARPVERFQDSSGKSTWYRYDESQHLVEVIDALQNVTRLERKPDGEVLRIAHRIPTDLKNQSWAI